MVKRVKQSFSDNQIVLEPGKYRSLKENLTAKGIDYDKFISDVKTRSANRDAKLGSAEANNLTFNPPGNVFPSMNAISKDIKSAANQLNTLLKNSDPTKIQFWGTVLGAFLVNPSVVSPATLQRIAENEVVSKCLSINVSKIVNSLGDVYTEDRKIQGFLRSNLSDEEGNFKTYVEQMYTGPSIFGHSVNYIRDYVDRNGYVRIRNLDLLPHSTLLYSGTAQGDISNIYQYVYSYPLANTQNLFTIPYFGINADSLNNSSPDIDSLASYGDLTNPYRTTIINTFGLVRLDKEKCIHFTGDDIIKSANPYGWASLSRRVYDLVLLYDLFKDLYTSFLGNRAVPIVVGYADQNATVDVGDGTTITAIEGMYDAFANSPKFGAILLSGLKDNVYTVDVVQSTGDSKAFFDGLEWTRKQIQQTLGLPDNIFESDASFAGATAQNSIYSEHLNAARWRIQEKLKKTYIKFLIDKNFKGYDKPVRFEAALTNLDDVGKFIKQAQELAAAQIIAPQMQKMQNFILKAIGYPLLDDAEHKEYLKLIEKFAAKSPKDTTAKHNIQGESDHYNKSKMNP